MTEADVAIPVRCPRCAGCGAVPIITADTGMRLDARPLLENCQDCGGSGWLRPQDEAAKAKKRA